MGTLQGRIEAAHKKFGSYKVEIAFYDIGDIDRNFPIVITMDITGFGKLVKTAVAPDNVKGFLRRIKGTNISINMDN
ncbi:MAG TPA: hypothetical protein VJJ52_05030 [Candidatus Nanoarchaeia archaeon]|nr:hypothetical protein [Candidatus Nanoarchaeia archaeon]